MLSSSSCFSASWNKTDYFYAMGRYSSSSSSSEEWVEADLVKEKKQRKSSRKRRSSTEYSDSASDVEFKKYTKTSNIDKSEHSREKHMERTKREDWMNLSTSFSSISNVDRRRQKKEEKKLEKEKEQYDPRKCSRELNPYWKDGGDGLPKFKRPKYSDSEDEQISRKSINKYSNWRKKKVEEIPKIITKQEESANLKTQSVTEEDLNSIAGKILKAEIMGNEKLVTELKEKLNKARQLSEQLKTNENEVLLTQTDKQGRSKPVRLGDISGPSTSKHCNHKRAVETHHNNERTKYFPDDDKYSLAQMFENEKFNTTHDQDSDFMKIASNVRKNDDMDDFFTDNVRRKKSDSKVAETNRSKAIKEHHKVTQSLENCLKCIQSRNMPKNLIISMGEYTYLSLPEFEPLTDGHCLIAPIRHVSSVTQLDENEWSEILDFRKSLVKMFSSRKEDVVFFEIAIGYHRYPHMILECVPLPKEEGDMAPIYFKKAIDESETEWAQNKKLVSLKGRDVRRAIPKGLPYFSVSFGMEEGYAHVIEDELLFPRNFAQEIIGGMLDLHHSKWRKPVKQSFQEQSKRVLNFSREWKDFDCTIK